MSPLKQNTVAIATVGLGGKLGLLRYLWLGQLHIIPQATIHTHFEIIRDEKLCGYQHTVGK